ncbi:MFS transporter [Saxibacter everestensis]|uniref:MFS transporter n=1 Tax=Saxibacter everestensis TaxID=2909229 RepID=A0ABY8QQH2_9MICO|nr:MFS transporter [Brevibacteriaceae bacterium ZFBP1038]
MFRPFRDVLALPGALAFSLAGLLARMPISMLGLGIVLLVADATGSYGIAGAVTAVFTVTQAVLSPTLARLVDSRGQSRIMVPAVGVHILALLGLLLSTMYDWGLPSIFISAILAGATVGSVGSMVRARWANVVSSPAQLHAAFSWESVMDEVVFIIGPVLVTVLATTVYPGAGIVTSLIAVVVGSVFLYSQRASEPAPTRNSSRGGESVIRSASILIVIVCFVFLGASLGSVDVIIVAFTAEKGVPALAGFVLALFALGSLLSGVIYGAIQWKIPVGRRFVGTVILMTLGTAAILLVNEIWSVTLVLFIVGFTIAPTLVGGNTVVQSLAPKGRLTEALAWIGTSLGLGVSVGSAGVGQVIDKFGAQAGFIVPVAAGGVAALVVLLGARKLTAGDASSINTDE